MKKVIVLMKGEKVEVWGNLVWLCRAHEDFSYSYIKGRKFPFYYKGWVFTKVNYNERE